MLKYRSFLLTACLVLTIGLMGCGPKDGKVQVRGVVLLEGEPLPSASLMFVGGGGGIFSKGNTDKNGKFSLRAPPGLNQVSVAAMDVSNAEDWADIDEDAQLTGTDQEMAEAMAKAPKPLVAQKYFNAATSGIEITVESGMSAVTIEVTKE